METKKYDYAKNDVKKYEKSNNMGDNSKISNIFMQLIDYLSPNDLLSLYLSSKYNQNMLNDISIITVLNDKYNTDTKSFITWYKYYLLSQPSLIPDQVKYLYKLEDTRYIDDKIILSNITKYKIMILIDWVLTVMKSFKLRPIALSYIPTFILVLLTNKKITQNDLQLYGIACIYCVALLFESYSPEIDDYVFISNNEVTEDQIREAIKDIITLFNGQIIYPSPIFFIDINDDDYIKIRTLVTLASMILPLTNYKPSLIAETCTYMITGKKIIYSKQEISTVCQIIMKFLNKSTKNKEIKEMINISLNNIKYICGKEQVNISIVKIKYHEPWHLGDFEEINLIGEGSYGKVKSVKRIQCGNEYAIKSTHIENDQSAILEIGILTLLKTQPNIIQLCGFEYTQDKLDLILPLYEYSLKDIKFTNNLWSYFQQILEAVLECHNYDIIHRDVKLENLVIKQDKIVLIDFGLSFPFESINKRYRDPWEANTGYYRPPECLFGKDNYGKEIDIWAVGCVFYYMITGSYIVNYSTSMSETSILDDILQLLGTPTEKTWPGLYQLPWLRHDATYKANISDNYPGKIDQLHKTLAPYDNLVLDCLTMNPSNRPTAKELLMKYF